MERVLVFIRKRADELPLDLPAIVREPWKIREGMRNQWAPVRSPRYVSRSVIGIIFHCAMERWWIDFCTFLGQRRRSVIGTSVVSELPVAVDGFLEWSRPPGRLGPIVGRLVDRLQKADALWRGLEQLKEEIEVGIKTNLELLCLVLVCIKTDLFLASGESQHPPKEPAAIP